MEAVVILLLKRGNSRHHVFKVTQPQVAELESEPRPLGSERVLSRLWWHGTCDILQERRGRVPAENGSLQQQLAAGADVQGEVRGGIRNTTREGQSLGHWPCVLRPHVVDQLLFLQVSVT